MSTMQQLKNSLKQSLEQDGTMKNLKADLMSRIVQKLKEKIVSESRGPPEVTDLKYIIKELILEYLEFER